MKSRLLSLMLCFGIVATSIPSIEVNASIETVRLFNVKSSVLGAGQYDGSYDTNEDGNVNVFDVIRINKEVVQGESYNDLKNKVSMLEQQIQALIEQLSNKEESKENEFSAEDKAKLDSLENYDDTEIKNRLEGLHNYDDTEIKEQIEGLHNYDDTEIREKIDKEQDFVALLIDKAIDEKEKFETEISEIINDKVDKENGKGLSSNDFTDEDKAKLDSLGNYDDTVLKEGKVDKEEGKCLSSNDFTDKDKAKLDDLSNYDDTEIKEQLEGLHNYDDTEINKKLEELMINDSEEKSRMENYFSQIIDGNFIRKTSNGYLNYAGKITSDKEISYFTDKLECEPGDEFYYNGMYGMNAVACVYYNGETVVGCESQANIVVKEKIITVPENVTHIQFGSYHMDFRVYKKGDVFDDIISLSKEPKTTSILYGKKWVTFGDSFTCGDFTGYTDSNGYKGKQSDAYSNEYGMYKTYPYWIMLRNNMTLINNAHNGYKITDLMHNDLYKQIPEDTDYVTFLLGLNESNFNGEIDSDDPSTFYGAWNTALKWVRENRPNAKVGIIIPTAWLSRSSAELMIEIGKRHGVAVLDLYSDPTVPALLGSISENKPAKDGMDLDISNKLTLDNTVSKENGHPNVKCHKNASSVIERFLMGI